ncbi:uncharacterized protein JN550_006308 [Neoarthrinium moseri]|uniref:uncharacterized protein n=1 Tax=Neoarthrinium moseri TaxID=1658444 RepID=UPI001FDB7C4C|nr:uncharacterized protein JN550_006308 [Neoarthrinium moseri]KAI1868733.1 hypothetical protein JN550_006308 [Neoarthrinium moseri]
MYYTLDHMQDFDLTEMVNSTTVVKYPYGYIPHRGINLTLLAVYAILSIVSITSILQCFSSKHGKWMIRTALVSAAVFAELVAYVERTRSVDRPRNFNDFLIQLTLLNVAPAFLTAAISTSMYQPVKAIGPWNLRKRPKICLLFVLLDLSAMAFIVFGSLTAFDRGPNGTGDQQHDIANMHEATSLFLQFIVATMVFQITSICVFFALLMSVAHKAVRPMPKDFVFVMVAAGLLVLMRAIVRLTEGGLYTNEWIFVGFDSLLMICACSALMAGHPILTWNDSLDIEL